ncbi:GerAB/ArcD/ProY family transporter [Paenibacillus lignilyticus]|uniref:GerAB/ArcD/ProY family transporter n=1 Tax=Paenibacillus lignilyticus TaxID=1172615 RepID=A0ABS5CCF4_9BACL|nr:GerAB/ArcD/ProY family transporter [Paenibacillus lignilyticus]MBP3961659.1 GerAB/ArcD/ProY family transporter [Paenibacillus lignilyticus]MBP3963671.1 GerAB/ArcD/ProY family transporter [Paenibacillus lignilyticus]
MNGSEKLSAFHMTILVYMMQFGVVIFMLPQMLSKTFGTNGWIVLPGYGLIVIINLLLIGAVYKLGKGKSIFDILEHVIPRMLLMPLYLFLVGVWAMLGCLVGKEYVLIFQMLAFPTTNPMLFKLVMDVLIFWLMIKGLYNISKAATMFFWFSVWMLLLVFFFYGEFSFARLTPFFLKGGTGSLADFVGIYSAYLGYELVMLTFPSTDAKTKFLRSSILGSLLTTIIYTYICFVAFGFLSPKQLNRMLYPLLDLMAYIKFPFVERLESLFCGFFLFTTVFTVVMYLWSAKETGRRIFPKMKENVLAGIIVLLCYIVAYVPDTISDVQTWFKVFSAVECIIAFTLPLLLIIVLALTREKVASA